jgi:hypothetical protein
MTLTTIATVNALLAVLVVAAVAAVVRVGHKLSDASPQHDERWGHGGNPWVSSDPLPLLQVARHEDERELARAA